MPPPLAELLSASDEAAANHAWSAFLEAYSRLLLHTARTTAKEREAAMDGYAYILEKLREDDFRRLRAYAEGGRAKFTTWLVVVTRRLVLDHRRSRYGRDRGEESEGDWERRDTRLAVTGGGYVRIVDVATGSAENVARGEWSPDWRR